MTIIGNLCLGLAALVFLVPLQFLLREPVRQNDGGIIWASIFVLGPLWLLIAVAMCIVTSLGGFDWLPLGRGSGYFSTLVACAALAVVTGMSMVARFEPQMPRVARLFSGWAVQVFPLVALGFCFLTLNPSFATEVPPAAYRIPFAIIAGMSLLAGVALLIGTLVYGANRQTERVNAEIEYHNERDIKITERVQTIRTVENFPELLGFANRFEKPDIRELAIKKAQAHPQFTERLGEILSGGWAEKGMVYLDACDPPDPKVLAEPVLKAILHLAADARDSMERTHTLHADDFDWNARLILSVADKFASHGVDYVPAIREFRAALDLPRRQQIDLNARHTIDTWLKKQTSPK